MRKNIQKAISLAGCAACLLAVGGCGQENTAPAAQKEAAVGLVDKELVIKAHPDMAGAQQALRNEYAKVQNEMMDVKGLQGEQRQKKVDDLRNRVKETEKARIAPIEAASARAMEKVMKENGLVAVFDKNAIAAGGVDITKDVLIEEGLSDKDADDIIAKAESQRQQN